MHDRKSWITLLAGLLLVIGLAPVAYGHGVDENTRQFLLANQSLEIIAFIYIGAKHMITGYDHLLFLVAVIFFLYRSKDVLIYVSLFTLGHSITLMTGVLYHIAVDPYLVDAVIGLSIVYKGFDNLGGFQRLFGHQPNPRAMVLVFGLFHGFGLATKLQDFSLDGTNLFGNLVAFNIGVELGQVTALLFILLFIALWRRHNSFLKFSTVTNSALMTGGLMLTGFQLTGYFLA